METSDRDFDFQGEVPLTELIRRARAGCEQSRGEAFSRIEGYLFAVASRFSSRQLASKEGHSDLVQQSFLRAVENYDTFRGESSPEFRGWLRQVVINEIRQSHRNWHRQIRDIEREQSLDGNSSSNQFIVANELTPSTKIERAEQLEQIRRAIEKLPEDYRRVIQLRNFEQMSLNDIAPLMGRNVEAVTKLWYRAVLKLKSLVGHDE